MVGGVTHGREGAEEEAASKRKHDGTEDEEGVTSGKKPRAGWV
jgi:hypothetical protein